MRNIRNWLNDAGSVSVFIIGLVLLAMQVLKYYQESFGDFKTEVVVFCAAVLLIFAPRVLYNSKTQKVT